MISLYVLIALVLMHFVADFIFQTDWVAKGKSTSNPILFWHVTLYCIPFLFISIEFAVINALLHFITDWFTSRATSYLWKKEQRHWFFVVIGLDQAIHMICLFSTFVLLGIKF